MAQRRSKTKVTTRKSDWRWGIVVLAILVLAVAITAGMTKGFKDWNPYGWFDKKTEEPKDDDKQEEPEVCVHEYKDGVHVCVKCEAAVGHIFDEGSHECKICAVETPHVYDERSHECTVCGDKQEAETDTYTVTLYLTDRAEPLQVRKVLKNGRISWDALWDNVGCDCVYFLYTREEVAAGTTASTELVGTMPKEFVSESVLDGKTYKYMLADFDDDAMYHVVSDMELYGYVMPSSLSDHVYGEDGKCIYCGAEQGK